MTDPNVFQLSQPGSFADPLTEVLRNDARALLAQAVEAEVAQLLFRQADRRRLPAAALAAEILMIKEGSLFRDSRCRRLCHADHTPIVIRSISFSRQGWRGPEH